MEMESRQANGAVRFRLETGLDVLEDWAETASQSRKNAVYKALFAMTEGSLFRTYRIVEDFRLPNELYVLVKDDLVMKICINCYDSFGVVAIGRCADTADLQAGRWRPE
jgi:hypothetical protein